MKPGERIRLITDCAKSLIDRPWSEIQLTLREHGVETYDRDNGWHDAPDDLTYCIDQIGKASNDVLLDLHEYLLGADAAPRPQQTSDRPWGSNPVVVFISHRHEDAHYVGKVRDILGASYGIDAFVAHNDINPSAQWRATIRAALASCHFMVALLHEKFHESQWCDQEVGWAMGRGVPIMPVRREAHVGPRFDGFMEEYQDCVLGPANLYGTGEWWLADRILDAVLEDRRTNNVGVKALAEAFVNSGSYDTTRAHWARIEKVDHFDSDQLRRLEYAVKTNRQVYEANVGGVLVPELVKQLVEKFEPPPPPDPWATPGGGSDDPPF